jgi:uncharacterized protein YggU (UPF0235/DUF167 family)
MGELISVKVITRAKKAAVERTGPSEYRIRVVAPPEKGRANQEALKLLAAYLEVSPACLSLVRGHSSNHKVVSLQT